jgi:nucleoside diphosphate kinase
MERSVYLIKPEAMARRDDIRQMLEQHYGLPVTIFGEAKIGLDVLATLYPDVFREGGELWEATCNHLLGKICEIGIVEGENAIRRLFTACGEKTNPQECGPSTVRAVFQSGFSIQLRNGGTYWLNVIHRPKDLEEANRDLKIAYRLSLAGP